MLRSILLSLLVCSAPLAQTFTGAFLAPDDYAASVPLQTTLSVEFSEPLSSAFTAPPSLLAFPAEDIEIGEPVFRLDGREVSWPVTLQPDTRYSVILTGARSETGETLSRLATVNFTTRSTTGSLVVSGRVQDTDGGSVDGALVALIGGDLVSGDFDIVAVEVLDASGSQQSYRLGPVPISLYTAGAAFLGPLLGDSRVSYGFLDNNGDGTPDPILFPNGNDIDVAAPEPETAVAPLPDVESTARGVAADAQLVGIQPSVLDADGRSPFWAYTFNSLMGPDIEFVVVHAGLFNVPQGLGGDQLFAPLPDGFVDSDVALAAAEAAGGADFRAANVGTIVTARIDPVPNGSAPVWTLRYVAPTASLTVLVDVTTGAVISATDAGETPVADGVALDLLTPNPFNGELRVRVALPSGTDATVSVFDALGRRVAVLHDGPWSGGDLAWRPTSMPAGRYLVRLSSADHTRAVRATLVR